MEWQVHDADGNLLTAGNSGTIGTQSANTVYAGPTSGGAADPTFRALVRADVPRQSVVFVVDEKTQGTNPSTYTASGWRQMDLNTEKIDTDSIASVATNQITIASGGVGEYVAWLWIRISSGASASNVRLRLWDATNSVVLGEPSGWLVLTAVSANVVGNFTHQTRFTISGSINIQLQIYPTVTTATGLMAVNVAGFTEVYSAVMLQRIGA